MKGIDLLELFDDAFNQSNTLEVKENANNFIKQSLLCNRKISASFMH